MHKLFIIGLGKRGLVHVDVLSRRNDLMIIGGYDQLNEIRRSCQQSCSFPIYDDLAEGLKQTQPDFILIATPPKVRIEFFEYFSNLSSLKAVFIEKPLALSMHEAMLMTRSADELNFELLVIHQSQFCDEFIALKETIASGRIGNLVFLRSSCYGNLFNQGSHAVDLIRWLTNGQRIIWVDATGNNNRKLLKQLTAHNTLESDPDHPGDLWSNITMRLESGIEVFMSCGWLDTNPLPHLGPWLQRRIVAVGTHGVAESHLSSYFKEISAEFPYKVAPTSINEYLTSLHRFYEHAFSSLLDLKKNRKKILEDHLLTLGAMFAAFASAKRHELIPLSTDITTYSQLDEILKDDKANYLSAEILSAEQTLISVIIPMETNRGIAEEAALSWIHQNCHSNLYELIFVFNDDQHSLKSHIEKLIRPQDKTVCIVAANEIELSHYGAMIAKGKFLLFTESHCTANTDTVEQAIHFFQNKKEDGFYPHTDPIYKNLIGKMESRLYELAFSEFSKSDYWAKITLHAFGIKREVYFEAGGFDHRYNRFSYWLLAANLHIKGYSLGYAPSVKVNHTYVDSFSNFDHFMYECVVGECQFRLETLDKKYCRQYFGLPNEWKMSRILKSKILKLISSNYLKLAFITKDIKKKFFSWETFIQIFLRAHLGKARLKWFCQKKRILSKIGFLIHRTNTEIAWNHYYNYTQSTLEWFRIKCAFSSNQSTNSYIPSCDHYPLSKIDDENLFGFYIPEKYQDQEFRWSQQISAIKLFVRSEYKILKLKLVNTIRQVDSIEDIIFFINHLRIQDISFAEDTMEFKIKIPNEYLVKQKEIWLILFVHPWKALHQNGEKRILGLPIQELRFETE